MTSQHILLHRRQGERSTCRCVGKECLGNCTYYLHVIIFLHINNVCSIGCYLYCIYMVWCCSEGLQDPLFHLEFCALLSSKELLPLFLLNRTTKVLSEYLLIGTVVFITICTFPLHMSMRMGCSNTSSIMVLKPVPKKGVNGQSW